MTRTAPPGSRACTTRSSRPTGRDSSTRSTTRSRRSFATTLLRAPSERGHNSQDKTACNILLLNPHPTCHKIQNSIHHSSRARTTAAYSRSESVGKAERTSRAQRTCTSHCSSTRAPFSASASAFVAVTVAANGSCSEAVPSADSHRAWYNSSEELRLYPSQCNSTSRPCGGSFSFSVAARTRTTSPISSNAASVKPTLSDTSPSPL
mmetsp:Transcript_23511/g.76488  ORF Transcript_23511/g.76488 Transcript_23511/m.76488 type:complete len:207 (-) Transcript_23511:152-772(-)